MNRPYTNRKTWACFASCSSNIIISAPKDVFAALRFHGSLLEGVAESVLQLDPFVSYKCMSLLWHVCVTPGLGKLQQSKCGGCKPLSLFDSAALLRESERYTSSARDTDPFAFAVLSVHWFARMQIYRVSDSDTLFRRCLKPPLGYNVPYVRETDLHLLNLWNRTSSMTNIAVEAITALQNSWLFNKNSSGKKVVIRHNISYDFAIARANATPGTLFQKLSRRKMPGGGA